MKIKTLLLFSALTGAVSMHSQDKNKTIMNPFFETYTTPYQVPPFDLIKNEHFKPAILEGIKNKKLKSIRLFRTKKNLRLTTLFWLWKTRENY